jgi:NDP-sugar pyrophosphorylase family protein
VLPIVILAGGLATRLRPLTDGIPKAMVSINGKPFIHWQIQKLAQEGFKEIIISIGHLGDQISDYLGNGERYNVGVKFIHDGNSQLGTGGALTKVAESLTGKFLVTYGDSYLPVSFSSIGSRFEKSNFLSIMTITSPAHSREKSNILFSGGRILEYSKNSRDSRLNFLDYGLLGFSSSLFKVVPSGRNWDLEELIKSLISISQMEAIQVDERCFEIGSFEGINELTKYLEEE